MFLMELKSMILLTAMIFPISPTPYHTALTILMTTILTSLMISHLNTMWLSMILIIIMLGGLMIIIFYIISLTKMTYMFKTIPMMTMLTMIILLLNLPMNIMNMNKLLPMNSLSPSQMTIMNKNLMETLFSSFNTIQMFLFTILFLIISLSLIMMMLKKEKGTMQLSLLFVVHSQLWLMNMIVLNKTMTMYNKYFNPYLYNTIPSLLFNLYK